MHGATIKILNKLSSQFPYNCICILLVNLIMACQAETCRLISTAVNNCHAWPDLLKFSLTLCERRLQCVKLIVATVLAVNRVSLSLCPPQI